MIKSKLNTMLAVTLMAFGMSVLSNQTYVARAAEAADEAQLIAALQSGDQKKQADACRELAHIGTKNAVNTLATLLPDEKMSHMARYALETIPDPAVDDVLRAALEKVNGRLLAGVIGSIGVRRDVKAIEPLSKLLKNADADVAQAAARALGKIGTADAAKAIDTALDGATAGNQLAFCEGLFRCAEALGTAGQKDAVLGIYQRLSKVEGLHQVKAGALRGTILTQGKQGIATMLQAIRSDDFVLVDAAARTAIEMREPEVTKAIADELATMPSDKKLLFTQVLGERGDAAALPALYASAKSGEKSTRIAAIRAVSRIGQPSSANPLIALLRDNEREVAQAAQEALAGLQGKEVDQAIMAMLEGNDSGQQVAATELVAQRRMSSAMPSLMKAAGSSDANVRQAALKRVGDLATVANLPALLEFLLKSKGGDVDAAEQALSTVCVRASQPEACTDQLVAGFGKADAAQQSALLRVLSAIGGTKALQTVRNAVGDANPQVHAAAIRALGSWESVEAAPHLLELARASSDAKDKMLCLRSYLTLASSHTDLAADQRLAMCKEGAVLAQKPEEKKLLLSTLGSITSVSSLAMIEPYLSDASTKEEASAAAVGISEKILKLKGNDASQQAAKLVGTLEKVIKATSNDALGQKAKALLQQAMTKGNVKPI